MRRFLVIGITAALAACGSPQQQTVAELQFAPAAFRSDQFSTGPTDVTVSPADGDCVIPDDMATLKVSVFGSTLTQPVQSSYDVADIDADCKLGIFLPVATELEVVVRAFDADANLVRKSIAELDHLDDSRRVTYPTPLWPAKRLTDTTGGNGTPLNLRYVEVMRQFDQFLLELAFADRVYPATRGGETSLFGSMALANTETERDYTVLFDAVESGLTLYDAGAGELRRAPFEFISGGVQIALPYAVLGGANGSDEGVVDAPDVEFSVTVLTRDDTVADVFPETGRASFND